MLLLVEGKNGDVAIVIPTGEKDPKENNRGVICEEIRRREGERRLKNFSFLSWTEKLKKGKTRFKTQEAVSRFIGSEYRVVGSEGIVLVGSSGYSGGGASRQYR